MQTIKKMRNGQFLMVKTEEHGPDLSVDIAIGDSAEQLMDELYFDRLDVSDGSDPITGRCGLEGLAVAYRIIRDEIIPVAQAAGKSVVCLPSDSCRSAAYSYLHRLGFYEFCEVFFSRDGAVAYKGPVSYRWEN